MADSTSAALRRLIEQFERMPGIGRKTAQRIAFYIIGLPKDKVAFLAETIATAGEKIHRCSVCCNLTEGAVCPVCSDDRRDRSVICVVQDPQDVMALEKTGEYSGVYHVLHGAISPLDGIGPDQLTVKDLLARLDGGVKEVILATNSDTEGEATALYLAKLIKPLGIRTTRLAYGLPVGLELRYADYVTLGRALDGRRELN